MTSKLISPKQFAQLQGSQPGTVLVDVRSPGEYASVHAAGAANIPLGSVSPEAIRQIAGDGIAYFICKSGGHAGKACQQLMAAGNDRVVSVEGGTDAWLSSGLDVVRGAGVISIERQVRIGAGLLVLIGVVLGFWVSSYFLILSGFVGAGLMFAGITDWCGMGLLLARMPWNQAKATAACETRGIQETVSPKA